MRSTVNLIVPLFLLLLTASAFPIKPQDSAVRRRAAYSVVAVDGGAAATSSTPNAAPPHATTILQTSDETVTVTAPAVTLPPSIETIIATQVVTGSGPVKTVEVVVTHDITKTTSFPAKTGYVVVNDNAPPAEAATTSTSTDLTTVDCTSTLSPITPSTPATSALSMSTSTIYSTPTTFAATKSVTITSSTPTSTPVAMTTSTLPQASIAAIETVIPPENGWSPPAGLIAPASYTPSTFSTHPSQTPTPMSTSRTYNDGMWQTVQPTAKSTHDNGMWHTTYHKWNATSTVLSSSSATASAIVGAYAKGEKTTNNYDAE